MQASFYEELEHTADWAIRVWGATLPALFEHAAAAMFELQGADLDAESPDLAELTCEAADLGALLVAWLNELLYYSETGNLLFTHFATAVDGTPEGGWRLAARAHSYAGRGPLAHIKAVTFYNLSVQQEDGGWTATVTFDT